MGAAEVIAFEVARARKQWTTLRQQLHERFDQWLDTLEQQWHEPPAILPEVTATVWDLRQQLTGGITETIVKYAHEGERQRQQASCPRCARVLKRKIKSGAQSRRWWGRWSWSAPISIAVLVARVSIPSTTRLVW